MPRKFIFALLCCCSALAAQQLATKYGITVQYAADFTGHSWKQEAKLTQQGIGTDIPEGVAPLRPVSSGNTCLTPSCTAGMGLSASSG